MTALIKFYLKTFLITGITFAALMSTFDNFRGEPFSIAQFLFWGIGFGLFMSLTLVTIHKEKLKAIGINQFSDQNLGVNQKIIVSSNLTEDQIFDKLKSNSSTKKMEIFKDDYGICLETGLTWKSFGEYIYIKANPQKDSYEISSRPSIKITLIDYGKNLENVIKLKEIIAA